MATLYKLTAEHQALLSAMENEDISEDDFATEQLALGAELEKKLEGYVHVIKMIEMQVQAASEEAERLSAFRQSRKRKADALKSAIMEAMKATDRNKMPAGLFTVSYQNSPATVEILNENEIPEKYLIPQPPKVDKALIKKDLAVGEMLENGSAIVCQNQHLRIR